MKRIFWARSVAAAVLILMGMGSMAVADNSSAGADERLAAQIWTTLHQAPDLQDNQFTVDVDDGIVILEGSVDSEWEKKQAQLLAHFGGILGVNNRLKVRRFVK